MIDNLNLALQHAGRGWYVFPCNPDKTPRTAHWKDDATIDPEQIRRWSWRDGLVGIYCEKSGFFALDIDRKNGVDGMRSWIDLVKAYGKGQNVECGPVQNTPSGGYHWLFCLPEGVKVPNNAGKMGEGLDLRSTGYICTGPGYKWIEGHGPDSPLVNAPAWMIYLIQRMTEPRQKPEPPPQQERERTDAAAYWYHHYLPLATEGTRNNSLYQMGLQLNWSDVPQSEAERLAVNYANAKGLPEREALSTMRSAYKAQKREPALLPFLNSNGHHSAPRQQAIPQKEPPEAPPPPEGTTAEPSAKERRRDPLGAEYVAFLASMGYDFRLCALDDSLWVNDERMSDPLEAEIRTLLRDNGYGKVNIAADAYLAHARKNTFNPITDFLNSLRWDGQDHIGAMASYITDKHGVFPLVLRKWMIGAVARPMTGGKQNRVMVLEGTQGVGKSYFARWLGSALENRFSEAMPNPDDKDSRLALATTWIWEIKELGSVTRRADRESLKAWLTLESVQARPPFGKHEINKPAITSFIATVNDEGGFFNDPTGSRRYMTASIQALNWSYARDLDPCQLWAQAFVLFQQGEAWDLTAEENQQIAAINDEYSLSLPVHDWLDRYTEPSPGIFTEWDSIRKAITETSDLRVDNYNSREIAGWMRKHGYESGRQRMPVAVIDDAGGTVKPQKQVRGYFGVKITRRATFGREDSYAPEL